MSGRSRVFALLERMAARGEKFRVGTEVAERLDCDYPRFQNYLGTLKATRQICGGMSDGVTILVGPQAGKKVRKDHSKLPQQRVHSVITKASVVVRQTPPSPAPDHAICWWCEKPHHRKTSHGGGKEFAACCSDHCSNQWRTYHVSQRQFEARTKAIAQQPRGCATVEEFLAAGGTIYREAGPRP